MDSHFISWQVPYVTMNDFVLQQLSHRRVDAVNIYISLDGVFDALHRPQNNDEFQAYGVNAGKQMVKSIFGILAHYRNWGLKYFNRAKVYGIYTSNIRYFKNSIYNPHYREKHIEHYEQNSEKYFYINEAILGCIPILPSLGKYIEDVHIIDTHQLEPSIIPLYLSDKTDTGELNILLTRYDYDLQYSYRDNWIYIYAGGHQKHTYVNRGNLWDFIITRYRSKTHAEKLATADFSKCNYNLFPIMKSIVGDRVRSIVNMRTGKLPNNNYASVWNPVFSALQKIHETVSNEIANSAILMRDVLVDTMKPKFKAEFEWLDRNIICTDCRTQVDTMTEQDKIMIDNQLEKTLDTLALHMLNQSIMREYPLDLQKLTGRPKREPLSHNRYSYKSAN